jgi:hypothetical protein
MPEVGRFAMVQFLPHLLDYGKRQKGAKTAQLNLTGLQEPHWGLIRIRPRVQEVQELL